MIEIKLLKDCAEVTYKETDSKVVRKIVSLSDIPALFETKINYDSGILPLLGKQNAYGIQRIIQRDSGIIVLVQAINPYVNVRHTELAHFSKSMKENLGIGENPILENEVIKENGDHYIYEGVYFPNLLMSLHLKPKNGKLAVYSSGILGFKDYFITEDTQLYDLPYSNCYRGGSHGGICWGNTPLEITSVAQAIGGIQAFLGSIMNTDLFDEFSIHDQTIHCSSELMLYLALRARAGEINSFPHDDVVLEPLITYGNLIAFLNQTWK